MTVWLASGETPFDAVTVNGKRPLSVGVPPRTPSACSVTPAGKLPVGAIAGGGKPLATIVTLLEVPP